MKSWISKALLGLFIAAPSVMARLPSTNGTVGGIYLKSKGMTTSETRMLQNSLGLWLSGMTWVPGPNTSSYRYQAYPDGAAASITVEKIVGFNPKYPSYNSCPYSMYQTPLCGIDISRTKNSSGEDVSIYVKVYTKYWNGSVWLSTETKFQNLMTGLIGSFLDPDIWPLFAFETNAFAIPSPCDSKLPSIYGDGGLCGEQLGLHRVIQIYRDGAFYIVNPSYTQWDNNAGFAWSAISSTSTAIQHSRYILSVGGAWDLVEPNSFSVQLPSKAQTGNRTWLIKDAAKQIQYAKCISMTPRSESGYGYVLPTEASPFTDPNAAGITRLLQMKGMQVSPVFRQEHTSSGSHVLGQDNGSCNTFLGYALDVLNGN